MKFLIKRFIKNAEDISNPSVRQQYGFLSGLAGVFCNILLFGVKLTLGLLMRSIAVISDAFNNFSDMGSSLIAMTGTRLAGKNPDKEHPFGHGRFEYIAALAVAFIIMIVGFELARTSVDKIFNPSPVQSSPFLIAVLTVSVSVKIWMFCYNTYIAKLIDSPVIRAAAKDSINDVFATSGVIIATIAGTYIDFPFDGVIGTAVALIILYNGFGIAKDTVNTLLGTPPSKEFVAKIKQIVMSREEIAGIHDLVVHDYGPGRVMVSLHAEVRSDGDILKLHEAIDDAERDIQKILGAQAVIHMDPIDVESPEVERLRGMVAGIVASVEAQYSIHDFRIVKGENHTNLIFDMVVLYEHTARHVENVCAAVKQAISDYDARFNTVIQIDHDFGE